MGKISTKLKKEERIELLEEKRGTFVTFNWVMIIIYLVLSGLCAARIIPESMMYPATLTAIVVLAISLMKIVICDTDIAILRQDDEDEEE